MYVTQTLLDYSARHTDGPSTEQFPHCPHTHSWTKQRAVDGDDEVLHAESLI